jgi:hypothetical protein
MVNQSLDGLEVDDSQRFGKGLEGGSIIRIMMKVIGFTLKS